jgi:Integrase core domain
MNLTDHSLLDDTTGSGRAKRQRRIRAHSTPGQVAGAATNNTGLAAHRLPAACPTSASQEQPLSRDTDPARDTGRDSTATVSSPDNGSAFTARSTRLAINALGVTHHRGGYRDPESQAFIESWFGKLKQRVVWRTEFETLDQAREVIAAHIHSYHDRPHSRLNYQTPREVRATWDDATGQLQKLAA